MTSAITNTLAATAASTSTGASSGTNTSDPSAMQNRFLTLLVAQLNNQDPMNPMDNAQITTQMAQLSTTSGIQQLNQTVSNMSTQFASMQALQGAALVGHDVLVNGNTLSLKDGVAKGGLNLAGNADKVTVKVLDASGAVVDTLNLGAMSAGQNSFQWTAPTGAAASGYSYQVSATSGGKTVSVAPETQGTVVSVSPSATGLTLKLLGQSTPVAYTDVQTIL